MRYNIPKGRSTKGYVKRIETVEDMGEEIPIVIIEKVSLFTLETAKSLIFNSTLQRLERERPVIRNVSKKDRLRLTRRK